MRSKYQITANTYSRWLLGLLAMAIGLSSLGLKAQEASLHHPRVAELEDQMKQTASDFIRTRFPELPFFVNVMVDPLRRSVPASFDDRPALPWSGLQFDEIIDEWDDPATSLHELQTRVVRIQVEVAVPMKIRDHEIAEMREALTRSLRLIPARDTIVIERREWAVGPTLSPQILYLSLGVIVVLLLGLYLIQRMNLGRLSQAVAQQGTKSANTSAGPVLTPGLPLAPEAQAAETKSVASAGGWSADVNFRDTLKTREIISQKIHDLVASESFPLLEDLTQMEVFSKVDLRRFGALLAEFPLKDQQRLMAFARSRDWLKAAADPGLLGPECLLLIERMQRARPDQVDRDWEDLRIQAWRLEDQGPSFVRSMGMEDAFVLLASLPRFVSIPIAREAFPGSWGGLLNQEPSVKTLPPEKLQKYLKLSFEMAPLLAYSALESYLKEKDLLDYLKLASVEEERDIYRVSGEVLAPIRPPFFEVLEAPSELTLQLVQQVSLSDLALSMFNVPKQLRIKFEGSFTPKQKMLYYENLKLLDAQNPDPHKVGAVREKLARVLSELQRRHQIPQPEEPQLEEANSEEPEDEDLSLAS